MSIFVMAMGLGLCINMYGVLSSLAFKTLDYPNADRLVAVERVENGVEHSISSLRAYDFRYFLDRQTTLDNPSGYQLGSTNVSTGEHAERVNTAFVLANLFSFAPVNPLFGRLLIDEDNQADAPLVTLISYDLWERYFGAEPDIIGNQVRINGAPHTIVGVLPVGYQFPFDQDLWVPLKFPLDPHPSDLRNDLGMVGHLKPGITLAEANREFRDFARQLEIDFPATHTGFSTKVWPYTQTIMSNIMAIVYLMSGAALFILLLACANVGGLMLVRASERNKEVAVRRSLGAPKYRIIQLVMMETFVICAFAACIGIPLAGLGLEYANVELAKVGGSQTPFWFNFEIDAELLLLTVFATVVVAVATSIVPAAKASGVECVEVLKEGTRSGQGRKLARLVKTLVVAEIFLAVSLLTVAGSMVAVGISAANADYGLATEGFVTGRAEPSDENYPEPHLYYESLLAELRSNPDVMKSSGATSIPGSYSLQLPMATEGLANQEPGRYPSVGAVVVADEYFDTIGVRMIAGRDFDAGETAESERVAIVSKALADTLWHNENPIGKRIRLRPEDSDTNWLTVVGMIPSITQGQPFNLMLTQMNVYLPLAQTESNRLRIIIRGSGKPAEQIEALEKAAATVDPFTPVYDSETLDSRLANEISGIRFIGNQFLAFALVTVILAATGIYGVMSRSSTLRTHEIGVRRALGATNGDIIKMLLVQGAGFVIVGAACGLLLGLFGVRQITALAITGAASPLPWIVAAVLGLVRRRGFL